MSMVVNKLLAEWTTLTENEIGGTRPEHVPAHEDIPTDNLPQKERKQKEKKKGEERIIFKDPIGRKYAFPFYLAKIWQVRTSDASRTTASNHPTGRG
jgi:hypothetical protein